MSLGACFSRQQYGLRPPQKDKKGHEDLRLALLWEGRGRQQEAMIIL
jgi:hypothetical protein